MHLEAVAVWAPAALVEQVDPGLPGAAKLLDLVDKFQSKSFLKFQAFSKRRQCQFPHSQFCNHEQYISTSQ